MEHNNDKLVNMNLAEFVELLASEAPAPGGGSASALAGAVGSALVSMVSNLTLNNKKYAQHENVMRELLTQTKNLHQKFIALIDEDTAAFNGVSAVFAMPKDTDEQKAIRSKALQDALKNCVIPPFEMMVCAKNALELFEDKIDKFNENATSDLGVAALSLKTAMQGAWLNILINIGSIKDEEFATRYRKEGEELLANALPIADRIYETISSSY